MNDVVINIDYGGLGDHLFHSPLPRLLKEAGLANRVYLSGESSFRDSQIFKLVWSDNPYLDGVLSKPGSTKKVASARVNSIMNIIAASYGLNNIVEELVPEIYMKVDGSSDFSEKKFLDLNYISFVGALSFFDYLKIIKSLPDHILVNPKFYLLPFIGGKFIKTTGFWDYVNLVHSCQSLACLTSGGASLSAAFGKSAKVYYGWGHPQTNRHSMNQNIMIGGSGFFRRQLCRLLFKKNQIRLLLSKNK